jgi:hypothetical protein
MLALSTMCMEMEYGLLQTNSGSMRALLGFCPLRRLPFLNDKYSKIRSYKEERQSKQAFPIKRRERARVQRKHATMPNLELLTPPCPVCVAVEIVNHSENYKNPARMQGM